MEVGAYINHMLSQTSKFNIQFENVIKRNLKGLQMDNPNRSFISRQVNTLGLGILYANKAFIVSASINLVCTHVVYSFSVLGFPLNYISYFIF
ncbi:hypothetical protein HanPSC8_Chr11g0486071 [Helianthus annuus]|nr:hypothetical protein HanPSC8_Chr11g0486071 [Helianthus annuus]